MQEIINERLLGVFREVFDDEQLNIDRLTTAKNVNGWDSLAHVNLLFSIEQEFGIKFPLGETQRLKNVGDLLDTIQRLSAKTKRTIS